MIKEFKEFAMKGNLQMHELRAGMSIRLCWIGLGRFIAQMSK